MSRALENVEKTRMMGAVRSVISSLGTVLLTGCAMSLGESNLTEDAGTSLEDAEVVVDSGRPDSGTIEKDADIPVFEDSGVVSACGVDGVSLKLGIQVDGSPTHASGERLIAFSGFEGLGTTAFLAEQVFCGEIAGDAADHHIATCGIEGCDVCVPKGQRVDIVACPAVPSQDDPSTENVNEAYLAGFARWEGKCGGSYRCNFRPSEDVTVGARFEFGTAVSYPIDKPEGNMDPDLLPEVGRLLMSHGRATWAYSNMGREASVAIGQGGHVEDLQPAGQPAPVFSGEALTACAYINPNDVVGDGRIVFGKGGPGSATNLFDHSSYAVWLGSEGLAGNRKTFVRALLFQAAAPSGEERPQLSIPPQLLEVKSGEWSQVCLHYDGAHLFVGVGDQAGNAKIASNYQETLVDVGSEPPAADPRPIRPTLGVPFEIGICQQCPLAVTLSSLRGDLDQVRIWPFKIPTRTVLGYLRQPRR